MIDPPEDENLRHETILQLLIKPPHSDLLDGDHGAVNAVPRFPNHRERTGTDLSTHQVVANHATAPRRRLSHFSSDKQNRLRESRDDRVTEKFQVSELRIKLRQVAV